MVVLASRMESKNDVYVISLDAVDLNFLPICQKPYDGRVVPLWSKSNLDLRSNEYYEFEIKTNDTREERKDQVIENVICHICDINVPKVYFNEHKNSFRHKFNAKIADIALRRLQLFMNKDEVNESYEKIPSKHYCSECSLVIDSDDEISHKQSIVHRNSIFLERFLNDFLKLYTNDENEINDTKEESKISKRDSDSSEENEKLDSSSILYKALQVKDEVVDGGRFKATEMNFNPLTKISSRFEYCVICDRIFVIEKRSLHLNSDLHCENLLHKLPDEYGIRKVNNTQDHCILCNNSFINYKVHIHSKEHRTKLQNMMISDERKKTAENHNNFNAPINETNVDTKSYSDILKSNKSESSTAPNLHTAPLKNKTVNNSYILPSARPSVDIPGKLFCDSCNVWISVKKMKKHQNTMKHTLNTMSDYHYLLKYLDKDNLCCKICDVTVSNISVDIINHFKNLVHIDKYDKLLQANNITKRGATKYYCEECKVYILHKNEYLHIESKQHKDKISLIKTEDIDECTDKIKTKTVYVELGNAIKAVEPGDAGNVELWKSNVIEIVKPGNAVSVKLDHGNTIETVEPGNAVQIELGNGNAIETVELSDAVNVELGNGNAIEIVEPGDAGNVELCKNNAIEIIKPGNAVSVKLDHGNTIETVEPSNAVQIELGNGNAIETVELSDAVNVELGNCNAIETVELGDLVNVELGNGNTIETVEPGDAGNVELCKSNAIGTVELSDAVNVELGNCNAIGIVEPGNAVQIELGNGNAIETVELSNAVNVELGYGNAIETVEPGNAVQIELGNGNAIETVELSDVVNFELGNGNAIETVEPGDAGNVELCKSNAIETVELSDAVNVELGNGNAIETVEPGDTGNVELCKSNAIEIVKPGNAVSVELDHGNAIKTVELGNAVNVELGNGNAIETVELSDVVNFELGNGNAIETVEPGDAGNVELCKSNAIETVKLSDAVNVELGNGNAIETVEPGDTGNVELCKSNAIEIVKPGNAVSVELDHGNAIKTVELRNAVNVELGNCNAIETVKPGNAVNVELDHGNTNKTVELSNAVKLSNAVNVNLNHGNAIETVELDNAVYVELSNGNAIETDEVSDAVNVELEHGNTIKTVEPGNAIDDKVVNAANSKALETIDKCGPSTSKDIRTFQPASVRQIKETAKQSENTVKPGTNSYFCKVCKLQVPNSVNNILEHNKGRSHLFKLQVVVETRESYTRESKAEEASNMYYQLLQTDTKNVVFCRLCKVKLTFNDKNISTHVDGETHKHNYSEFCKRNLLVASNNGMYCTVCGVKPGLRCEITHCTGKKHKQNLANVS